MVSRCSRQLRWAPWTDAKELGRRKGKLRASTLPHPCTQFQCLKSLHFFPCGEGEKKPLSFIDLDQTCPPLLHLRPNISEPRHLPRCEKCSERNHLRSLPDQLQTYFSLHCASNREVCSESKICCVFFSRFNGNPMNKQNLFWCQKYTHYTTKWHPLDHEYYYYHL